MHCLTKGYSIYAQLAAQNGKELSYKKMKVNGKIHFPISPGEGGSLFSSERWT